VFQLSR